MCYHLRISYQLTIKTIYGIYFRNIFESRNRSMETAKGSFISNAHFARFLLVSSAVTIGVLVSLDEWCHITLVLLCPSTNIEDCFIYRFLSRVYKCFQTTDSRPILSKMLPSYSLKSWEKDSNSYLVWSDGDCKVKLWKIHRLQGVKKSLWYQTIFVYILVV